MNDEVIKQLLLLFVLMVIGFAATKAGFIDKVGSDKISSLISRVTMPAMYIATFMAQQYSAEKMMQCGILLGISVFYYVIAVAVSILFVKLTRTGAGDRGVYQFLIIFSNAAYMGFPVLKAVLGDEAIFYGAFFNLPFNIFAYSLGIYLLRQGRPGGEFNKKEMFLNPGTLGVLFGALLFVVSPLIDGTKFHQLLYKGILYEGFNAVGSVTIPLSMLVIGCVLATVKPTAVVGNFKIYAVCAIRLLAMPALILLCLLPLHLEPLIAGIPVLISGMPGAVFTVILSKEYGGDEKTASVGVFMTTLLSAVTIPIIASWL